MACKAEGIKCDIKIDEITEPNQQCFNYEQPLMLHQPNAFHTIPDILQHFFGFLDHRKVTQINEYEPNYTNKKYYPYIYPY